MDDTLERQLKWARSGYRWQVMLSVTFPLHTELKPTKVCLRLQNIFDHCIHMIPDTSENKTYWFFMSDNDCQGFINHVNRFFNMDIDRRLCSNILKENE